MDNWIKENKPDGIAKLARAARIPSTSLQKVRQGRTLVDPDARKRVADVLGGEESALFSEGKSEKSRAS